MSEWKNLKKTLYKVFFKFMLAVKYIFSKNFIITERGILENWEEILFNVEGMKRLVGK
jgi:hypothetical protein